MDVAADGSDAQQGDAEGLGEQGGGDIPREGQGDPPSGIDDEGEGGPPQSAVDAFGLDQGSNETNSTEYGYDYESPSQPYTTSSGNSSSSPTTSPTRQANHIIHR